MELSNVGDRVFAAERILKKRKRRVGFFFFSHDLLHSVLFTFDFFRSNYRVKQNIW